MPETWMVEECRRQSLLYLAHATRSAAADGTSGMPEPLVAGESAARVRLRDGAGDVRGLRADVKSLAQRVKALFPTDESASNEVPDAWTYAELVGWWLQAGEALRGWNSADAKQYETVLSPPRGGLYPPFWCARRFDRLHFSFDAWQRSALTTAGPGPDWRGVGKNRREYRLKMLKWVMQHRRPRAGWPDPARQSQEWLQSLRQEFAEVLQDAEEMFGSDCGLATGGPLTVDTVRDWIPFWHAGKFAGGLVQEVRQPVMQSGGERATLIKGIAVLPPASFMCRRITSAGAATAAPAAGSRAALDFAVGCWGGTSPADPAAIPPPAGVWKRAEDDGLGMLSPADLDAGLLAPARLLTAIASDRRCEPAVEGGDEAHPLSHDALRLALAFEGFSLIFTPAQGCAADRMIPHAGPESSGESSKLTLRVALPIPGGAPVAWDVDVGTLGNPAACGDGVLAAVETVDWRIWALTHAPLAEQASRQRQLLLAAVNEQGWEPVKQQVLSGATSDRGAAMARLFEYTHRARLGVAAFLAASDDGEGQHLGGSLLNDLGSVRLAALAEAASIEPQALERCSPPRQADGTVHIGKWLRQRLTGESHGDEPILTWASVGSAFGMPVGDEQLDEQGRLVVTVSAGPVEETEIRCLSTPLPAASDAVGNGPGGRPLRTVIAEFQARLIETLSRSTPNALDAELPALRSRLAGADAPAFHELIERARKGDVAAVAWLDLLASDPRFDFRCHPPLTADRSDVKPPGSDDEYLTWADDPEVPAGSDIAVTFALDPRRARRVIGRGPREPGSAADLADCLVTAAADAGERLERPAISCRDATDRWRMFGGNAAHPVTRSGPLLEAILAAHDLDPAARQAVFTAVSRWCAALGHEVQPAEWRAGEPLPAERFPEFELTPTFDEAFPAGAFMLKCFGVSGPHGLPLEGAVSAGPAPAGFNDLRTALGELGNTPELGHTPKLGDLEKRLNDLAKQAANGRLPMVVPNLFDSLWGAAEAAPASLQAVFDPAKGHLLQLLKSSCKMVVFEPAKLTDYPSEWIVGPDGKRPSGNRIRKVLRPGVRTLSSSLVRPAIVETE
jgi:hypothetical protein